ncbi:aminotransferase class V-fold PLP-dependent enzyme [Microbacterium sp. W1N]|uniref:aminotransferase class V-fold PLP-dependent enzyme n=1 Tax=Microbacterium festucae TaxID=2977531 RepID=UPI0021BF1E23|nr:aminotransferase class V-fold PLP-dependent enzyme [Microbacterium festucae]MCT9821174.1 aminotransferase class V-fold PLP-dependent enzyme [Microbacterium festucae]
MGFTRVAQRLRPRGAQPAATPARDDFAYLAAGDVYLDSACQTLRPQPVIDAMTAYFTQYNACGDRAHYAWGAKVDAAVDDTRAAVLRLLDLPRRDYRCAFTLNTTYGLNLLLQQLPRGRFARIVTTQTEHNAVFVSTMTAAARLGVPRVVVERTPEGRVPVADHELDRALVVVSAMDSVTGTLTTGLDDLIARTHRRGGAVIVDAAQAAPHALPRLRGLRADAICFSAHKMYGPALGVVAASAELLAALEVAFVGGGQVQAVTADGFTLRDELHTRLEPGLQAWGEIIAFGAALDWFSARWDEIERTERELAGRLHEGLSSLPRLRVLGAGPAPVVSIVPERVDGHRLAVFLSQAGVMVRSGHFCAHHWLAEREQLPPLVRFSLGAHNTPGDIERALEVTGRLVRGL